MVPVVAEQPRAADEPAALAVVAIDPLAQLFDEHYAGLVRLAGLLVHDRGDAEDIVQEAFVAVDRKLSGVAPDAQLAYLRRAVVNGAHSTVRRRLARKRQVVPLREYSEDAADGVLHDEQQRRIRAALADMPLRQRECIVLRYYAGLNDREVAEHLGLSPSAVKTHLRRGLDALHDVLGDLR